ncbi:hypothetical protein [Mycolicibacterium austroafricanum]|uniref:hypothetical protein n=1 Tax=Mycolicibacterium austroafricanum TaxID=39687 RepID=UPI001CA376D7|nr:hypothetical protein [Mycolicibacterium austroafricanum]QZT61293.1 hypothetical protein JN085_20210 [Mycolicibacterium austroafricanum]
MAKGKYSAKAANRLAQTDNELLIAERAKVTQLQKQLRELESALEKERRDRAAVIEERAHELSSVTVERIRQESAEAEEKRVAFNNYVAQWLVDYFKRMEEEHPDIGVVPLSSIDLIAELVGNEQVGEYTSDLLKQSNPTWSNRHHRRLTGKKIRRNQAINRENQIFLQGENPLVAEIRNLHEKRRGDEQEA